MSLTIGIDIGGTKTNIALVNGRRIIKKIIFPTDTHKGRDEIMKKIFGIVNDLMTGNKVKGIGIGVPGLVEEGRVIKAPNLKGWNNFNLKKAAEKKFRIKTYVINDVNAMAIGEREYGIKAENMVCITVGTGLGGAMVIDNKLYYGKGNAGEIGHITIEENGRRCRCGNKGCLEEYVSARAINRESKKTFGKALTPLEIENMARKGNRKAKKVYENIGRHLGVGLAVINNVINPEVIVVGGGIAHSGKLLLGPAIKELRKRSLNKMPRVYAAKLGKDAGVIGASLLARKSRALKKQ